MTLEKSTYLRWYSVFAIVVLAMVTLRCYLVPFSHDEVATFFFYIQPGDFIPFLAHPDANGHFLTNLTSFFCFKLFGSSPLALRLPDILAAIVLVIAVYNISKNMRSMPARLVLIAGTLGAYNFMAYFALCRGYGLSMAFLLAAFSTLFVYFKTAEFKYVLFTLLHLQLGLAANLTFVAVVGVITVLIVLYMFLYKQLFKVKSLLVLAAHVACLVFWVKYGLFLKEAGALYYGAGESYWQVTFLSLINSMLFEGTLVNVIVLLLFCLLSLAFIMKMRVTGWMGLLNAPLMSSYFVLLGLIIGFFLLKIIAGVNYPEDRTGLFFYLLFVLSLALAVDESKRVLQLSSLSIPVFFAVQWVLQFDSRNHPWRVYETMPTSFYDTLVKEQTGSKTPITIGGHRVREFFYGFLNYNSATKLNHMTAPEALQMNTDYALAYKQDKPYYDNFYTELASEDKWGFRLLKRRKSIARTVLFEKNTFEAVPPDFEYFNFYEVLDTVLAAEQPVQADITFSCKKATKPMNIYAVMEIHAADEQIPVQFIRVPLNLIKYEWSDTKQFTTSIVSGNLPRKLKRLVVYFWNINKSTNDISIDSYKLLQLKGEGVTQISKAVI